MRLPGLLSCFLTLSALSVGGTLADEAYWYVPHMEEARTPVEDALHSKELAMPGFGISSSRNMLMKRFQHALDHKWLSAEQVDRFCNELKKISDKEQGQRDENGSLSYQSVAHEAKQLHDLNNRFEEQVLIKEQANPGIEGLQARKALMLQRVAYGLSNGKFTARRAAEYKQQIRGVLSVVPESGKLDSEEEKDASSQLRRISTSLEKEISGPSLANRPAPFSR